MRSWNTLHRLNRPGWKAIIAPSRIGPGRSKNKHPADRAGSEVVEETFQLVANIK